MWRSSPPGWSARLARSSGSINRRMPSPRRPRAGERRLSNVRFVLGDIHDLAHDGPFDAIIGRLVLMYVPDRSAVLRTQAGVLRSGGVVAPIEFDLHSPRSLPATPLVGRALSWLREAFTPAGVDPALGPGLWAVLQAVGLQPPGRIGVQAHFGPKDPDGAAILARIVRTVLPLIERLGVATAAEVGADTLQQCLSGELATSAAVFAHPMLISAWGTARQPSDQRRSPASRTDRRQRRSRSRIRSKTFHRRSRKPERPDRSADATPRLFSKQWRPHLGPALPDLSTGRQSTKGPDRLQDNYFGEVKDSDAYTKPRLLLLVE